MADPHSSSSPRDSAVDANPDLARKKQRLNPQEATTPSPTDALLIEISEPEEIGTTFTNAIEIQDGPDFSMPLYCAVFDCVDMDSGPPYDQLKEMRVEIARGSAVDLERFSSLGAAIKAHLADTENEPDQWFSHYLDQEVDFFTELALLSLHLLDSGGLSDVDAPIDPRDMSRAFDGFFHGMFRLTLRILPLLPHAIKGAQSRRDSAQASTKEQHLPMLWYVLLAYRLLLDDTQLAQCIKDHFRCDVEASVRKNRTLYFSEDVITELATIMSALGGAMRDIKDSWLYMHYALQFFGNAVHFPRHRHPYPSRAAEEVLCVINTIILPAICAKHPRALYSCFHADLVLTTFGILNTYAYANDIPAIGQLYKHFVRADTDADAVLSHTPASMGVEEALLHACRKDRSILAELLSVSWALQSHHAFLRSGIMDIRNIGITLLKNQLVALYTMERPSGDGVDHPALQHAVRFLRQNEITAYIFGPESRAGLVSHSAEIVCFLAATGAYTPAESDIIWGACSTSVEADFVKASFIVLDSLLRFLDASNLVYLARKYATTPVERLGSDSVTFLDRLFQALQSLDPARTGKSFDLTLVCTAMDILRASNDWEPSATRDELRHLTIAVISRFTESEISLDHKMQMYQQCIPEIQQHSQHATPSVEVLNICLSAGMPASESACILAMLPLDAAIDELCDFVHRNKQTGLAINRISHVIVRLECILRLMSLTPEYPDETTEDRLFENVFGESALSNIARDKAWSVLNDLTQAKSEVSAANRLWESYMQKQVSLLDARFVTPKLIEFIDVSLKAEFNTTSLKSAPIGLLDLPLWKALVRVARTSKESEVVGMSVGLILDLLFAFPREIDVAVDLVVPCQCRFVHDHIQGFTNDVERLLRTNESSVADLQFSRDIFLLGELLVKSNATASVYAGAEALDALVLDDIQDGSKPIEFTAQVYGPRPQPQSVQVRASEATKVSELIAKLPGKTAAADNRVIVGGREISLQPNQTLNEAQISQSGVLMIRPRYTSDANLEEVLACSSSVEREVMLQYGALESFLDGPDAIAQQAFTFLCQVRTPAQARSKVISPSASPLELFPNDKPWRCKFTLAVLQSHLLDFVRLGVADQGFISRSIRLLVSFIQDASRPLQPMVMLNVATCLYNFLQNVVKQTPYGEGSRQNHAKDLELASAKDDSTVLIDNDDAFVSRIVELIYTSMAQSAAPARSPDVLSTWATLAHHLYKALLETCRAGEIRWDSVVKHAESADLHRTMLLSHNQSLSKGMAACIGGVCGDSSISDEVSQAYWDTLIPTIPHAMAAGPLSEQYFTLLAEVFLQLKLEEPQLLILINTTLKPQLWKYRPQESPGFPVVDKALFGLLSLLRFSVLSYKSCGNLLKLEGLAWQLAHTFLFDYSNIGESSPPVLVHEQTRALVYSLIRAAFCPIIDYERLVDSTYDVAHESPREMARKQPAYDEWWREPWVAAGLQNLGMTCYMNSLLQQLFANLQFRKFILERPRPNRGQAGILRQVQDLFARMQSSAIPVVDTEPLAVALGVQIGNQEDVHTFYTTLFSRLEEGMGDADAKNALARFFTGKSVTQIRGDCGHVSPTTESFTELPMTVKNKASLNESLDEFVQGEPMEGANKYRCVTCNPENGGRYVNAMRRACLEEVPDNLTFCLKRFAYETMSEGENKVNDRFEFPKAIDMSPYKRSFLEDPDAPHESDIFELVGVIVHQGSLQFGHYWSYVRVAGSGNADTATWLYLEDARSLICANGVQDVQAQCFGGPRWTNGSPGSERVDSAYVLFYQRQSYIAQAEGLNTVSAQHRIQHSILPRVGLHEDMASALGEENHERRFVASLHAPGFHEHILWLLTTYPIYLRSITPETPGDENKPISSRASCDVAYGKLGAIIARYMSRILLADPSVGDLIVNFRNATSAVLDARPLVALTMLQYFAEEDGLIFGNLVHLESAQVRSLTIGCVDECLSRLRLVGYPRYAETYEDLMKSHAKVLGPTLDASGGKWTEYLKFAAQYARIGQEETHTVLEAGYLSWALGIINFRYDPELRKKHWRLTEEYKLNSIEMSSLIEFILNVLEKHVSLPEDLLSSRLRSGERARTSKGWSLLPTELQHLTMIKTFGEKEKEEVWTMLHVASKNCNIPAKSEECVMGKLIAFLVGDNTPSFWTEWAEEALKGYFQFESHRIKAMLYPALHYCLQHSDDANCQNLMECLTKNAMMWNGCEIETIDFFDEAMGLVPSAVVHSMPFWVFTYLSSPKSALVRARVVRFLQDRMYSLAPLTDIAALDAGRINFTRTLCAKYQPLLLAAYRQEHRRTQHERSIEALQLAQKYLISMRAAVAQALHEGTRPSMNVMMEYDESNAVLAGLKRLFDEIGDWQPERTTMALLLPARTQGQGQGQGQGHGRDVRRSVELESTLTEPSDVEGEEGEEGEDDDDDMISEMDE
ncbi:hypothetical protein BDY17DRAFT_299566 [Neohortaea acidophila]|uniref:USP domain-containing protein n=1 Tax=Neohortaea acidophila TaxID=245834 RepID=A0A6A6PNQ0_9PEZI|nr:uncharacterized protein BDY17DRAFT_299566 [Neohortaea acidophila]KAF2481740.1 hypothetical protein BDY17DRAFT_299566 [Neohortaea acidophila]